MDFRSALKSVRSAGWVGLAALALWAVSLLGPLAGPTRGGSLPDPAPRAGSARLGAPKTPASTALLVQTQSAEEDSSGEGPSHGSLLPADGAELPPAPPAERGVHPWPSPAFPLGGAALGTRARPPPGAVG